MDLYGILSTEEDEVTDVDGKAKDPIIRGKFQSPCCYVLCKF